MDEHFSDIIRAVAKGDTGFAESYFRYPGGRRYLKNITLILINTLAPNYTEKEEMYAGFVEVLNQMEESILRRKEGQIVLENIFPASTDAEATAPGKPGN